MGIMPLLLSRMVLAELACVHALVGDNSRPFSDLVSIAEDESSLISWGGVSFPEPLVSVSFIPVFTVAAIWGLFARLRAGTPNP
jgi:hypothetical protein